MSTIAGLLLLAYTAFAQSPFFEAASVKPVKPGLGLGRLRGGPGTNSPGQISGSATLKFLLMSAYDLKSYQIAGPAWIDSERYEVIAKIPAGAGKERVALMLRSLLAERFGVVAHRETRELPIYEMAIAKNGTKLRASTDTSAVTPDQPVNPRFVKGADGLPDLPAGATLPRNYEIVLGGSDGFLHKLWARRETMPQLADRLSGQLNRAVVDKTGLKDQYDFTFVWAIETAGGGMPRTDPPPDEIETSSAPVIADPGLSLFTAIQSQLGLRLEQKRGPLEMLVVDAANKTPTGN